MNAHSRSARLLLAVLLLAGGARSHPAVFWATLVSRSLFLGVPGCCYVCASSDITTIADVTDRCTQQLQNGSSMSITCQATAESTRGSSHLRGSQGRPQGEERGSAWSRGAALQAPTAAAGTPSTLPQPAPWVCRLADRSIPPCRRPAPCPSSRLGASARARPHGGGQVSRDQARGHAGNSHKRGRRRACAQRAHAHRRQQRRRGQQQRQHRGWHQCALHRRCRGRLRLRLLQPWRSPQLARLPPAA